MRVVWARSTRRHRVGRASTRRIITAAIPTVDLPPGRDAQLWWVGPDERGRVLEVVTIWQQDLLMIVHVMATALRERKTR